MVPHSVKTLASHGIQSINLTAAKAETVLPDGSRITGQATFTRSNGTTGTVADASLNYDPQGHAVAQMAAANANGTLTVANMHRRAHRHARMIPYGADQQDSRLCRSIAEAAL